MQAQFEISEEHADMVTVVGITMKIVQSMSEDAAYPVQKNLTSLLQSLQQV